MSKKLLTTDAFVKKTYTYDKVAITSQSTLGAYYSNDITLGMEGYEIYSIVVKSWVGAYAMFNVYSDNNKIAFMSDYSQTVEKIAVDVVFRRL